MKRFHPSNDTSEFHPDRSGERANERLQLTIRGLVRPVAFLHPLDELPFLVVETRSERVLIHVAGTDERFIRDAKKKQIVEAREFGAGMGMLDRIGISIHKVESSFPAHFGEVQVVALEGL